MVKKMILKILSHSINRQHLRQQQQQQQHRKRYQAQVQVHTDQLLFEDVTVVGYTTIMQIK